MILQPWQVAVLRAKEAPNYVLFLRIETPTKTFLLWTGVGAYQASADDDLAPNELFDGTGILRDVPPMRSLRGGIAERMDLTFSGVDELAAQWMDPASDIEGAVVNIGIVWLDKEYQPRSKIGWFWPGIADVVTSDNSGRVRTITLSVVSGASGRAGSENSFWTPAQFRIENPTDSFWKMVFYYSIVTYRKW